jgi:hypothetical protein
MDKRIFKVLTIDNKKIEHGRYKSKTPAGAARKAFNRYARQHNNMTKKTNIKIQETTRGSKRKIYEYKMKRITIKPVCIMGGPAASHKVIIEK